ncbi:NAD(P)H-dependent oxidoreductase [Sediminitomix flava]|uniref:Nitroreductase n=1 Tax=Sediminitomix flava TaxID=379075 RepID=A0A315Z6S5_SEDFL|nr:NAD(P)H-dependent oxidoreductase [Sediminitomix flava]PWJ39231.1 nitroreductase [Sediminitomix flava]
MNTFIDALNWRYAVKKFDNTKEVSVEKLERILEAGRLSASSYGLQPYTFLLIENKELRAKLKDASWNQTQIVDASHLLVLCANSSLSTHDVDLYIKQIADTRGLEVSMLEEFSQMMKGTVNSRSQEELTVWAQKQVYIAVGNILAAAALENVDSCPMEGFDPAAYVEILNLSEKNLLPTVVIPLGYRSEDDSYQQMQKVRKKSADLYKTI